MIMNGENSQRPAFRAKGRRSILRHFLLGAVIPVASMLALGIAAIWVLTVIGNSAGKTSREYLPRLQAAESLVLDATSFANLSTQLSVVTHEGERATVFDQILSRGDALAKVMETMPERDMVTERLDAVSRARENLMRAAYALNRLVETEIVATLSLERQTRRVLGLCQSGPSSSGETRSCNAALLVLAAPANAAVSREAWNGLIDGPLADMIVGDDGVVNLKARLADITNRKANIVAQQRDFALGLVSVAAALQSETEQRVWQQQVNAAQSANLLRALLAGGMGVALMATIAAYMAFHRRIILRLLALKNAMVNWDDQNIDDLPMAGNDEIADMNRGLRDLLETIRQRTGELEVLAATDFLTGLPNRRHFFEMAQAEWERMDRYGTEASILMADIDRFKAVNDAYGHHMGDVVIQTISHIWRDELRKIDLTCRMGGEEFAAILPQTSAEAAFQVAERIRQRVEAEVFPLNDGAGNDGAGFSVTLSVGIVGLCFENGDAPDLKTVLARADEALYSAKEAGRNCIHIAPNPRQGLRHATS